VFRMLRAVLFGLATAAAVCAHAEPPQYLSPSALAMDSAGGRLYVAEETARAVAVVDAATGQVARTVALDGPPSGLALTPDGKTLCVTLGAPKGQVAFVDVESGSVSGAATVGHTAMAPVCAPDGALLYVCNRFDNSVSVVDAAAKREVARIAVSREPVAAALTPDGTRLFVANLLPTGAAVGGYMAASVSVIDTASRQVARAIALPNGSGGLRGICASPDGAYVYVTHVLARYQLPTTQLERGWMNTNALTILDAARMEPVATVLLDEVELGAANPWGVACSADGKTLCVAHAGTHELSVVDRAALHAKIDAAKAGAKVSEVTRGADNIGNDLSFLAGIRKRVKLPGKGPRALALCGGTAYAAEYFSDSLAAVDLAAGAARAVALGPRQPLTAERQGELFFHDASLCFQQWQSCSSCHPDARSDGFNWDLLNDGIGNPKSTKSMLLSHRTPPVMSLGARDKAETAVRSGIRYIQFAVRPDSDAAAIDSYLKSMSPVPSPHRVDGALSEAAKRGEALFQSAGCAQCHPGPLFTDLQRYDIGTGAGLDAGKPLDTPTIVEVWRTAPYLHDGRAATMVDVLREHNVGERHGATRGLTDGEIQDLAEYVLSL